MTSFSQKKSGQTLKQDHTCSDCKICLELLQMYLDGEADKQQIDYVKMHINTYKKCMQCLEFEKELRKSLKEDVKQFSAPNELLKHIKRICPES